MISNFCNSNPFSLHDFLGYLIPGGFFIFGLGMVHQQYFIFFRLHDAFIYVSKYFQDVSVAGVVFLVILSFVTGHLLSYLSSMTVQKYSEWTIGFPSKYLFETNTTPSWKMGLLLYWKYYFNPPIINNRKAVNVRSLARLSIRIQRCIVAIFLFPFSLIIFSFVLLGMNDTFRKNLMTDMSEILRNKSNKKIKKLCYKQSIELINYDDIFKLLYHFVIENCPQHRSILYNYHALYVYARTISLSFVIFFWASILIHRTLINNGMFWFTLLVIAFVASFFYLAFVNFYRKFTLECYMAIATQSKS